MCFVNEVNMYLMIYVIDTCIWLPINNVRNRSVNHSSNRNSKCLVG